MRNLFIGLFEKLVGLFTVLMLAAVTVGAVVVFNDPAQGGAAAAIALLVGGTIYITMMVGMLYLFLGVHHNTKRTVELLERIAKE